MSNQAEVEGLIRDIERRDIRFRRSQTVFVVSLIVGIIVLLILMIQVLSGIGRQLTALDEARAAATAQGENQLRVIEDRLNCIVKVFAESDRSEITIEDIDSCTLERDEEANNDASTTVVVPASPSTPTSPAQPSATPPANQPPTPDPEPTPCEGVDVGLLGLGLLSLCRK